MDSTGLLGEDTGSQQDAGSRDANVRDVRAPDVTTGECSPGETLDCVSVGICVARRRECVDLFWGPCADTVNGGMVELCNGERADEDCDGMTDEGCGCTEDVVCGSNVAPCRTGFQRCEGGVLGSECEGETPPVAEMCNLMDDDCDSLIDEGVLTTYFTDTDGDGVGTNPTEMGCEPPGVNFTTEGGDCNDGDEFIFPGNTEVCDGKDNDCNTVVDDGLPLMTYYLDGDDDGYGSSAIMSCDDPGGDYVTMGGDCIDSDSGINPNASEACDLIDNDCSGTPDDDQACHNDCRAHVYDGHVYQFCTRDRRWGESLSDCDNFGDNGLYVLVTIDDEAENADLNSYARSIDSGRTWWIGFTDSGGGNEGTFRWISGSSSSYTNWNVAGGEPNDQGGEDCTEMRGDGRWNDADCNADRYYICEEVD